MAYIHPREIDPDQPRLKLPWKKYFKYYVGIKGCEEKLRQSLKAFKFTTIAEVLAGVRHWPEYELIDGDIRPITARDHAAAVKRPLLAVFTCNSRISVAGGAILRASR